MSTINNMSSIIGHSRESHLLWKNDPNEPKNIIFSGQNVGVNIPNINDFHCELQFFNEFIGHDFF